MMLHRLLRIALLGRSSMPQAVDLPLLSPQTDVAVWLYGRGAPRDVTHLHSVACASPATLCISFSETQETPAILHQRVALHIVERGSRQRLLGIIQLEEQAIIRSTNPELRLYRATACRNYCVSPVRGWLRSLYVRLARVRRRHIHDVDVSALDSRCNEVVFACPRPVALLSLRLPDGDNIVPINLMASLGDDCFVMALNSGNQTARSVCEGASLALCTVPFEHAHQVRSLGGNHRRRSISCDEVPFALSPSPTLGVLVPDFAITIRVLQLEDWISLGSHTFFITRVVDRQVRSNEPEFYRIHGTCAGRQIERTETTE